MLLGAVERRGAFEVGIRVVILRVRVLESGGRGLCDMCTMCRTDFCFAERRVRGSERKTLIYAWC
jgi:hypothetical protein